MKYRASDSFRFAVDTIIGGENFLSQLDKNEVNLNSAAPPCKATRRNAAQ